MDACESRGLKVTPRNMNRKNHHISFLSHSGFMGISLWIRPKDKEFNHGNNGDIFFEVKKWLIPTGQKINYPHGYKSSYKKTIGCMK